MAHRSKHETFAEHLIASLCDLGVERIFGLVGDSLNAVVDAVRRTDGIEWVHVHNEEAAAFAASAEAQLTGRLAVCAASCGPGNTHLVQGLFDAHRELAPVLAIASHIPSTEIGTGFFQETHPEQLLAECSGYCELVHNATQGARILHIALQSALAGNGVSVLVVPGDVADEEVPEGSYRDGSNPFALSTATPTLVPHPDQVAELARLIDAADTVTIFAGAGVRGAHDAVMELADATLAPVGHALGGKEWIQYDNPYDVGMSGLLGYGAAYEATHEADLLILLGTDFPYPDFLPQQHTVQIDRNAARLGRRTPLDLALQGDVRATIDAVLPLISPKADRKFLDKQLKAHVKALEGVVTTYTRKVEKHKPIHPEFIASLIDDLATDDAVFTVDTGMCNVWAARFVTPNGSRRVLGSWHHGSMANALPHAIGAQAVDRDRQVISFSGDGGLAMLLGELLTVKLHALPIKVVVFNNSSLGMVKLEMLVEGLPDFGTDHPAVDYAAIAAGAGLPSVRITDPKKAPEQLAEALAAPGPMIIDVVTDSAALSLPPKITGQQIRGFATASTKIVLAGGVGKMTDMARSNLRNIPR